MTSPIFCVPIHLLMHTRLQNPPAPFDSKGGVVIECKGLVVRQATQEDTDELVEPGDKTLLDLYTFYIHITYGYQLSV